MVVRISLFTKINVILALLLIPIIWLNVYSNRTSDHVVQNEIEKSSKVQLSLLISQMNTMADQLSNYAISLTRDPTTREFINGNRIQNDYEKLKIQLLLNEKLRLYSSSSNWQNNITIYSPKFQEAVSNNSTISYDQAYLNDNLTSEWKFHQPNNEDVNSGYFFRHIMESIYPAYTNPSELNLIVEVAFSIKNLTNMLDQFKMSGSTGDPLLFKPDTSPILNSTFHKELTTELITNLNKASLASTGNVIMKLGKKNFLVNYNLSSSLGWYLVDYVPLEEILSPLTRSSNIFYISICILILIGVVSSFLLYKNVQIPIVKLISSVRSITRGNFSARINYQTKNEFNFLFIQFNLMAQQIEELIEKVYESKIRLQEATLKQLQSQIDPHFLYNCLFFIKNSSKMGDLDAIESMSLHLGAYYRYTTRLEKSHTSLKEELDLITNYLHIFKLRMNKLNFDLNIPETMYRLEIPRLILQPVVENAMIHGIEPNSKDGYLRIVGEESESDYFLVIEDNGRGMTEEQLWELNRIISLPSNEENVCGLWNVNQRLVLQFGSQSGLKCENCSLGGLRVTLHWSKNKLRE